MGGPLIIDVAGHALDGVDREVLAHPHVGGVILFTRNYEAPGQLRALCDALRRVRRREPLLITVDHEGGRVQRFRAGFTELPAARTHGDAWAGDPVAAEAAAREHGRTLARELLAAGVDHSYAPVLDLDRGLGSVIGDRAFSADPEVVAALGVAWIAGMRDIGMAACGKHFPGHGGVAGDSHHELPVDERSLADIEASDLIPFRAAIDAGIDAVMMAHVLYPAVDGRPASLSPVWVREVLRGRCAFDGVVVCDDLSMAGAQGFGSYSDRAAAALEAGCDLLPVCNHRDGVVEILDALPLQGRADAQRVARLARLRPRAAA
ncbi:MAG: beta-N-acetylhexosaminidase [Gammaproteobacteria bacterium]